MIGRASLVAWLAFFASISSAAAQSATEEARRHFETGTQAFDTGDYDRAIAEFEASYALTHHPDLLFNIYSSAERAGRFERAADALTRFLAEGEVEPDRRTVLQQRLARLRERIAAGESAAPEEASEAPESEANAAPEPAEPDPAAPPSGPHPAAIGTLIASGVLLAAFGVLAGLSEMEDGSLASSCGRDAGRYCTDAQVSTLRALDIAADASWITAAVAGVAGVILLFALPPEGGGSQSVALAPWLAPGSAGLVGAGRF